MKRSVAACVALAICLLPLALAAQSAPQRPLFRAGVEYVSLDVVVTDKSDKPITDLKKEDFEIVENGKTQTISDFQFVSVPVAHRTIDAKQPQTPESDVATNVAAGPNSRLFVMVIDDLHIIEQDTIQVKRVMTDFIKAVSPTDEVAVVFVSHSNLSQNFTTNTGLLLKTVDHVRDALGFGLDALCQDPGAVTAGGLPGPAKYRVNYARSVTATLQSVVASLAGSGHSRRAVAYISGGTTLSINPPPPPTSPDWEYFHDLLNIYDAARRADVPIYTVDPRGGVLPEDAVRGGIGRIGGYGQAPGEQTRSLIAQNIRIQQDNLSEIAINTGARAFIRSSNLTKAVDDIVGENGSFYLLGYSPDPYARDGKFHDVKVHVNWPGTRVRAKGGYVAPAPGPAVTNPKQALDRAMSGGVNSSGLSLRAFAAPVAASAKGMTTAVTIEVDYPAPSDGTQQIDDHLQVSILALDPDGKIKASSERALHFSATATPGQDTVSFLVDDVVDVPSQLLTLRVGVASQALGSAGTVQAALDVPKPSDAKLQMGGILLERVDAAREPAMNADVIKDLVPFQPTTTRTFAASDTLRVFARLFWSSRDTATGATLTVKGATTAPQTIKLTSTAVGGHNEAVLDSTVSLEGLAPGHYTLEIAARLSSGPPVAKTVVFDVR